MSEVIGEEMPGYDTDDLADQESLFDEYEVSNEPSEPRYAAIFDAPDYTTLIRIPKTAKAREYEKRMRSLLKAGTIGAINSGRLVDAATFLHYGPGLAAAVGDLAGADEKAAKAIDMFTSPASPALVFAATVLPFLGQMLRNHEDQMREMPSSVREFRKMRRQIKAQKAEANGGPEPAKVSIRVPFTRFHMNFNVRLRWHPFRSLMAGVRTQTKEPSALVYQVFTDEKLLAALAKQGISIHIERKKQA